MYLDERFFTGFFNPNPTIEELSALTPEERELYLLSDGWEVNP